MNPKPASAGRVRTFLKRALGVVALLYPLSLLGVWLAFRELGEHFWLSAVALYLPRIGFGLPLPVLALALAVWGPRWLLVSQLLALWLLVVPLMGFEFSSVKPATGRTLRVFSCNIFSGALGLDRVFENIEQAHPDVILLQESQGTIGYFQKRLPGYELQASSQFLIATRYPIVSRYEPERIPAYGLLRSPRFVGYTLSTPLGKLDLFHVHPISPREGFYAVRGPGLRREILSGEILRPKGVPKVMANAALRRLQVAAFSRLALHSRLPVIIAGDTNLPGLSQIFDEYLGSFQDGFAEAGRGFGYTFPVYHRRPWMRIDRILASSALRFVSFQTIGNHASDHLCVYADLVASPQAP